MRPELRTFRVNDHYLIGANVDMHVIILQPDARSVAYGVDFQADCMDHFFLSQDGGLLAAAFAFEAFCCIEVIDLRGNAIVPAALRENATIFRLDRVHALNVRLAPNGRTMLYWKHGAKSGTYAVHVPSGKQQRISKATFPTKGAWLANEVILPLDERKGGVRVSYWPLAVSRVGLPSKTEVWQIIEHPNAETVAMLDAEGQVASLRADTLEPLWQSCIEETDWISYSGDGRFIAVRQRAPEGGRAERIVLLDASSGEIARIVEQPEEQALFPLDGPRFLCYSGRFLNAETGEFEEGVSARGFWDTVLNRGP